MSHRVSRKRFGALFGVLAIASLLAAWGASLPVAYLSGVDVDVASVDVTVPDNSVTLAPGASGDITIKMSVTGNQAGTATFEVYRDWTLSGGTFVGSNPQEFTVGPRVGGDPATTFSTSGNVSVAASQADGVFTLAVGAFDITNTNPTGAKLAAGHSSNYQVLVVAPLPPSDTTAPVITPNIVGTLGDNGWYVSEVNLTWSVVDNESPVSSMTGCGEVNITADKTATTYTCEATSAGGTASEAVTIKRDATKPTLNSSVSPNPVVLDGTATANPGASDNLSGIADATCGSVDTSSVGFKSVTCTATDNAGNSHYATVNYSVGYKIHGLSSPVDMFVRNSAKAGQTIPLKWQLLDANDNPVLDPASVKVTVASLSCTAGTTEDAIEEYAAGASGLQNLGGGYYQFNWKTPTNYASSCKTMYIDFSDASASTSAKISAGLMKSAEFAFKK